MTQIANWKNVSPDNWTFSKEEKTLDRIIYRLKTLPNFSHKRFQYLAEDVDKRASAVLKKQMAMIRQFHSLGSSWSISFRIVKVHSLELYLLFRYAGTVSLSASEKDQAETIIRNALMQNEYSFEQISLEECPQEVLYGNWANSISEIYKREEVYQGAEYPEALHMDPQEFYVPYIWNAIENNMEDVCTSLLLHEGIAVLDVTLVPSEYLKEEKDWVNINIGRLKDSMNGETIRSENNNRILWQGQKIPILKNPIDNCEKMHKQFEMSRVFLTSIRVLGQNDSKSLSDSYLSNSTNVAGTILSSHKGSPYFEEMLHGYNYCDISLGIVTRYWQQNVERLPLRAQRLSKLACVEEISAFFRVPIPIKDAFPGFSLDTGLGANFKKNKASKSIELGSYLDQAGQDLPVSSFDVQQLAKHGLIVGVPGSGKTTAMFNILYQLWSSNEEDRIPFIVLEPAKTEYRALKVLPKLKDDLLVFTLGDESVSPFRFNPMEVLPGIKIENHISRLQACFVGAFNLFDPLPIFLEQAIRKTYLDKGWYDDSKGGDEGVETPTLSDLCRNAEYIVENSGFDQKMKSDFKASLLERLNSLRRGSKGRMLDTPKSIPIEDLMGKPVILELDSLNADEKALMMMFLLSYVYEYCKAKRKSGSPLKHMLIVEEAHNLISAHRSNSDSRADPGEKTIELFVNMLAEMRALGQGILIADQLPTAIAPQAVKQTNLKVLMRVTAKDDREEIGNTMDLNEEQMHQVVNFKTGHAYFYHEGEDRVRMIRMRNFKDEYNVEEPPNDEELTVLMGNYELDHIDLYQPFEECKLGCKKCNRRVRNQAENLVQQIINNRAATPIKDERVRNTLSFCGRNLLSLRLEVKRIKERYKIVDSAFGFCTYVHLLNKAQSLMTSCIHNKRKCQCSKEEHMKYLNLYKGETE